MDVFIESILDKVTANTKLTAGFVLVKSCLVYCQTNDFFSKPQSVGDTLQ